MSSLKTVSAMLLILGVFCVSLPVHAELINVIAGGELRIRGNYWNASFNPRINPFLVGPEIRIPATLLRGRSIGDALGGQNAVSYWDWDSDRADYALVEERAVLNFRAEFTDYTAAFIELESFDVWGEDFRSANYVTGLDVRAASNDDVEVFQAHIEANDLCGIPLRLRVGRQTLAFGGQWLVGDSSALPEFRGLSFDGIRWTYATDLFFIDAFWTKLAERTGLEKDGDVDFSGIYGSYKGIEDFVLDAYWFWVRDARAIEDVAGDPLTEWLEQAAGIDEYPVTHLHTLGIRAAGSAGAFDFEIEAAYQFGDAGQVGRLFKPWLYGDNTADFGAWAAHAEAGYAFDAAWQPRVYLRAAYFGGEDQRDITFWEWINPFRRPEASISFNRLFSNRVYNNFFDEMAQLSNAWTVGAGIQAHPSESVEIRLQAAYFGVIEPFDLPKSIEIAGRPTPIAGPFSFWTDKGDAELGWDVSLSGVYRYSEDLEFEVGWSHLFTGEGLTEGAYTDYNGLLFSGGTDNEDADYLFLQTRVQF